MNNLVTIHNDIPVTTSQVVAEVFGKQHQHVLRGIKSIINDLSDADSLTLCRMEDQSKIGRIPFAYSGEDRDEPQPPNSSERFFVKGNQ